MYILIMGVFLTMVEDKQENTVNNKNTLELGGHIELSGFVDLMPGSMTIIKKIVGSYTKRYTELKPDFEKLQLIMKPIHKTTDVPKLFHLNAKMIYSGKIVVSESEDRNIFHAIDSCLKKIEAEVTK
jgi:ribosome-associated translation inhibitor RaiA